LAQVILAQAANLDDFDPISNVERMALQGWQRGLVLLLLVAAACAHAAAPRFLGPRGDAKKKAMLLTKGPGFFRSSGVRGGVEEESMGALGDSGSAADGTLARSPFGRGMSYNFPYLDNLEPIAPMDRLHAALGKDSESGHYLDPVYVPKYLNPDSFPVVAGKGCNCSMPTADHPKIECSCGGADAKDHYTWLKDSPVLGTNNFTLEPADITYRGGNYWGPKTRGGLVAPADVMPTNRYPLQALGDHVWPLPASSQEDRLPVRYARYLDQVQDRSLECDTISERCTTPCKPGDEVVASVGNTIFTAKIVKAYVGNAVQLEFAPPLAEGNKDTADCPVEASCSAFRFCIGDSLPHCVHAKEIDSKNWAGRLVRKHGCPKGTKVCTVVSQVVMATMLKKDGKACKAVGR